MAYEHYLKFALAVGLKALFVIAILSSVALTYQKIIVAGEYNVATIPGGPDKSDYEAP